ncbi:TetR/AcrR family transcriptional regulator [Novosphingobium sp. RD2P27]|uniref:TetR/AcrR family transcriptional regulator n=1 Tax=Novosphingobium kalidii TaxID=3230299 RepID=A0ABV2CXX3_9SPHN
MTVRQPRPGRRSLLEHRWEDALNRDLNRDESDANSAQDRLIEAVFARWESHGRSGMSARQISQAAGISVSSIYHHFGSLERLLQSSQRACLAEAQSWCDRQIEQVDGLAGSPESFSGFFAHIVDDWVHTCRPLAFAQRECGMLASRSAEFGEQEEQWRVLWTQFWERAGSVFALGSGATVVERVFDGESLFHMLPWRRAVDRACLEETAHGLTAWLTGRSVPAAPWREFARAQAVASMPETPSWDEKTWQIVEAAADLIAITGAASVTHRSVAEQAGVSLGTVSHKFRTKSALLEAAFEAIYARVITRPAEPGRTAPPADPAAFAGNFAQAVLRDKPTDATDDLVIAAARDPALSNLGAQLRYLRGRTARAALQSLFGDRRAVSVLEGALFSSYLSAQIRRYAGGGRAVAHGVVESELEVFGRVIGLRP